METIKKKHKTEMTMTNIKLNQGLSDGLFTVEQLKQ
jgi:outer membrane lipoprotein-sorting protein